MLITFKTGNINSLWVNVLCKEFKFFTIISKTIVHYGKYFITYLSYVLKISSKNVTRRAAQYITINDLAKRHKKVPNFARNWRYYFFIR